MSEEKAEAPAEKPQGNMKLVIFCAVGAFVAALGAQVVAPMITGGAPAAATADGHGEEAAAEEEHEEELAPAQYVALDPPFVVSFDSEGGSRYLQLQAQAMARSEDTVAAIKQHAPAIRNAFLFLLSGYELEAVMTQAGKEELRHAMLGAANEILAKNHVEVGMEDLYFTSLVVQ